MPQEAEKITSKQEEAAKGVSINPEKPPQPEGPPMAQPETKAIQPANATPAQQLQQTQPTTLEGATTNFIAHQKPAISVEQPQKRRLVRAKQSLSEFLDDTRGAAA